MKKALFLLLILCISFSCTTVYATEYIKEGKVYMPIWMQAYSVIVYDEYLDYTIIQGGELTSEDIAGREDIAAVGMYNFTLENLAIPNTKVEYDHHGFIQNIYYLVPGTTDRYQLSNPRWTDDGTGMFNPNSIYIYSDSYYNYDTGTDQYCKLSRTLDGTKRTGKGRITYYTDTNGDKSNILIAYDCAIKMLQDDVPAGIKVMATNTYANKTQYYYKYDVAALPSAILDIWSDSTVNPITDITNNGRVDNVCSAIISYAIN